LIVTPLMVAVPPSVTSWAEAEAAKRTGRLTLVNKVLIAGDG